MSNSPVVSEPLLGALAEQADAADHQDLWPKSAWELLCQNGVTEWVIPTAFGGRELDLATLLAGYELLAGACLTTTFILSQRDAAVRRIRDSGRDDLGQQLLRPLACG